MEAKCFNCIWYIPNSNVRICSWDESEYYGNDMNPDGSCECFLEDQAVVNMKI